MQDKNRVAFKGALGGILGLLPKARKKTNVADTSKEAYKAIKKEGKIEREKDLIFKLIEEHQPTTNRKLWKLSKLERGNVCRVLFDLGADGKVKYPFTDKCPVTNKRVRFYTLINWEAKKND